MSTTNGRTNAIMFTQNQMKMETKNQTITQKEIKEEKTNE